MKTDCSVSWTAPDGKIYCFSSDASKETFLKNPTENIQKAREFFIAKDNAAPAAPATGGALRAISRPRSSPRMT